MSFTGMYEDLDGKALNSLVGFGKMKTLTVRDAINQDAGWVKWAVENVDHSQLDEEALSYLSNASTARVWRKGDILPFGKHKGSAVLTVLKCDASYLLWCFDNLEDFDMDDDLVEEAYSYKSEQEAERNVGRRHEAKYYPDEEVPF